MIVGMGYFTPAQFPIPQVPIKGSRNIGCSLGCPGVGAGDRTGFTGISDTLSSLGDDVSNAFNGLHTGDNTLLYVAGAVVVGYLLLSRGSGRSAYRSAAQTAKARYRAELAQAREQYPRGGQRALGAF